jgi:hypothetical protein
MRENVAEFISIDLADVSDVEPANVFLMTNCPLSFSMVFTPLMQCGFGTLVFYGNLISYQKTLSLSGVIKKNSMNCSLVFIENF